MNKDIDDLLEKIDLLSAKTVHQWGTMTPHKMVEHLMNAFKVSSGKIEVKCYTPEEKLPTMKKFLMSDRPIPKGFDNPANELAPEGYQFQTLEIAKSNLFKEAADYYKFFEENPDAKLVNPTFGELNKEEWQQFHKKHLIHHLAQFRLID